MGDRSRAAACGRRGLTFAGRLVPQQAGVSGSVFFYTEVGEVGGQRREKNQEPVRRWKARRVTSGGLLSKHRGKGPCPGKKLPSLHPRGTSRLNMVRGRLPEGPPLQPSPRRGLHLEPQPCLSQR